MRAFGRKKPELPSLPKSADPPVVERIIEKYIVQQVHGTPGKDGVDGKDAIPAAIYRFRVDFRRDGLDKSKFKPGIVSGIGPEDRAYSNGGLDQAIQFIMAKSLCRVHIGHDIEDQAIVGSRVVIVNKSEDILAKVVPASLKPGISLGGPSLLRLVITVEAFNE